MKEIGDKRKKGMQRDFNFGFKLGVLSQVEKSRDNVQRIYGIQVRTTVLVWLNKHDSLDWDKSQIYSMNSPKAKEIQTQKIKRLENYLIFAHKKACGI